MLMIFFLMVVVDTEGVEENILNKSENLKKESLDSSVLGLNKGNAQIKCRRKNFLGTNHGDSLKLI